MSFLSVLSVFSVLFVLDHYEYLDHDDHLYNDDHFDPEDHRNSDDLGDARSVFVQKLGTVHPDPDLLEVCASSWSRAPLVL